MEKITLQNRKGLNMVGILSKPKGVVKGTCVLQHGWCDRKESPMMVATQETFVEHGYQVFNFDATNSVNESDGDYEDSRLGLHYEDMEDVCKWAQEQDWFVGPLVVSGHSMGGYAAVRYAEDHPEEVARIVSLAPVISGILLTEAKERINPGVIAAWKEKGYLEIGSVSNSGVLKRVPYAVHEEWMTHDLLPNAHKLTMPVFLLVGTGDRSCSPDHIKQLFDAIPHENKVLEIVEGAPHTFRNEANLNELRSRLGRWLKDQ